MKPYKVLSVRQPYAALIAAGLKDVENIKGKLNFWNAPDGIIKTLQLMGDDLSKFIF